MREKRMREKFEEKRGGKGQTVREEKRKKVRECLPLTESRNRN